MIWEKIKFFGQLQTDFLNQWKIVIKMSMKRAIGNEKRIMYEIIEFVIYYVSASILFYSHEKI